MWQIANGATIMANRVDEPMIPIALCRCSCIRMCAATPSEAATRQRLIVRIKSGENGFSRMNFSRRDRFERRSVCCRFRSNGSR